MTADFPQPFLRQRLERLADDCEELAWRRAPEGSEARAMLHMAARKARGALASWFAADRRKALAALDGLRLFALWLTDPDAPEIDVGPSPYDARPAPTAPDLPAQRAEPVSPATPPPGAMNAPELARQYGMTPRGALKRITNAYDQGAAGAYREGRRWYADPVAFGQKFRMSSDWAGRATLPP